MIEKESAQAQLEIYKRLSQLDEETQQRISQKYYHGTRPWLKATGQPRRKRKKSEYTQMQEE